MAVTQSTRLSIYRWSSGSDSFTRSQLDDSHAQLETLAAGFLQDVTRPTAALQYEGFIFYNTGTQALSYCDGAQWIGLNSFGTASTLTFDQSAVDGVATTTARSDHKHALPGFGSPVDVSTSLGNGAATTTARSDHQHKLAVDSVPLSAMQNNSVGTAELVTGAVTNAKIGPLAVGAAEIASNAVTTAKILDLNVTTAKLDAAAVTAAKIAPGVINTSHVDTIDASVITGTLTTSADIDASKVISGIFVTARIPNLDAGKITTGVLSTSRIPSLAASIITSGTFATARIPSLAASIITSGDLSDLRGPERIKTTFAGTERQSRIYVNTLGPSGGQAYDIWIEY